LASDACRISFRSAKGASVTRKTHEGKGRRKAAGQPGAPEGHAEGIAAEVQARIHEQADAEIQRDEPAVAADRLVDLAEASLLKAEAERAKADAQVAQPPPAQPTAPVAQSQTAAPRTLAELLIRKAEQRIEALPAPLKQLGRATERAVALAFWPARFGWRLAGEVVKTPVQLVRFIVHAREA
jgi:hypothetical protein